MKRLLLLLLLFTASISPVIGQTTGGTTPTGQVILVLPGESGSRQFGDLIINYSLSKEATSVQCTMFLFSQFVGIRTLSAISPTYNFDLQVGLSKASGSITLLLSIPGNASTLAGSFDYTGNSILYTFKGDIVGWYIKK